jgi:hypothetical protein
MSFWDVIWFIVVSFAFVAYLMVMFAIITDLFRDRGTSGIVKAVWIVFLIIFPLLTSLVYLIARGSGMAERSAHSMDAARRGQEAYIREVASGGTPADEIAKAKSLLEAGAITDEEYQQLKARALAGTTN